MNSHKFFLGLLLITAITFSCVNADVDSVSGTLSNTLQPSGTISHLNGEKNLSSDQNREATLSSQSGSSSQENDSSAIPGSTRTTVTRLTGGQMNPSSGQVVSDVPTSLTTPTQGFLTGTQIGPGSGSPSPVPSPVMSDVPTSLTTPTQGFLNGTHFGPGSGSPSPVPSPVMSNVPTPMTTPSQGFQNSTHIDPGSGSSGPVPSPVMSDVPTPTATPTQGFSTGTHFGPGSGSPSPVPTPVMSDVPTPIATPSQRLQNETHFGPGSGTHISVPSPVMSDIPTPITTPSQGFLNGTHFGPGSGSPSPVPSPAMSDVPTPLVTPISGQPNDPYQGPGLNPINPIPTPTFTQPMNPGEPFSPEYPDGRFHPGPVPTVSLVTITVTPTPEQWYGEPTHVPGDNDPDPIMSDILLHRGDPNYYYGRYSNPDPGHYRYESSPLYAPRYDRDNGAIQVISTPTDATVYLNNNYEGRTPSSGYLGISSLTPGSYQITISSVGYYDYTSVITVYRNEIVTVNAALEPVVSGSSSSRTDGGTLDVQSSPTGAGVLLNNVYRGSSPLNLQSVSPGEYNLTIFKDGYIWYARDISITSGQTTAISAVLTPQDPAPSDQSPIQSTETVVPVATKSPLPIGILFISLIVGGFCASRRL